jgi:hypothetical protein
VAHGFPATKLLPQNRAPAGKASSDRRAAILRAHEEIYAAIARHGAAAAGERMREHIEAFARYAQRKFPEVLDQTITWDRLPGRAPRGPGPRTA